MRSLLRPTLSVLLVVLITMWGTCPCLYAQMLGAGSEVDAQASESGDATPGCLKACCCKSAATPAGADTPDPHDGDCPCCDRGGWMRDLPPQAQAIALELPAPSAFDLPVLLVAEIAPDVAGGMMWTDLGPPSSQRPHASPVGIVRLLN